MNASLLSWWDGPREPGANFHESCRCFTGWGLTAQMGVNAALRRRGLPDDRTATFADLAKLTTIELRVCRGIGPTTVEFLRGQLSRAGLTLADEAPGSTIEDLSDEALIEMLPARRGPRGAR